MIKFRNFRLVLWAQLKLFESFGRCSWRLYHHKRTHTDHKPFHMCLVQRGRPVYFQRSAKLCNCKRQDKRESWLEHQYVLGLWKTQLCETGTILFRLKVGLICWVKDWDFLFLDDRFIIETFWWTWNLLELLLGFLSSHRLCHVED